MKIISKKFGTDFFTTNFCVRDDVQHARRIQSIKAKPHPAASDTDRAIEKKFE